MLSQTLDHPGPLVAALVLNSVSHDARVLKEADSLANAGYRVVIIGVRDARCDEPRTAFDSGVVILRMKYQQVLRYHALRRRYRVSAAVVVVLAVTVLALGLGIGTSLVAPLVAGIDSIAGSTLTLVLLGISAAAFVVARRALKHRTAMRSLLRAGLPLGPRQSGFQRRQSLAALVPGAARLLAPSRPQSRQVRSLRRGVGPMRRAVQMAQATLKDHLRARLQRVRQVHISSMFNSELARIEPDVVHCHDLNTLAAGEDYVRCHRNARLVLDCHELYEETATISKQPAMKRFWSRSLARASRELDGFITVNDSIAAEYRSRYPSLPDIHVVRNATPAPTGSIPRDSRLREAAGLGDSDRVLLYQGGFARHRGLEGLVEAAGELPDPWVLVMMGWGNLESELRAIASRVDPHGLRVRFIPAAPQPELPAWTSGADVGVIPYENTCLNHWFCSPNKLWEYPVAGVPMLVSDFPELRKVVDEHGVGLTLPPVLDGSALRVLLADIDEARLQSMREACRRFLEKDNWCVYESRLVDLYRAIAPGESVGRAGSPGTEEDPVIATAIDIR